MAALWAMLKAAFGIKGKQSAKVVVVGLDGSGKTTILNHLKPGTVRPPCPGSRADGTASVHAEDTTGGLVATSLRKP